MKQAITHHFSAYSSNTCAVGSEDGYSTGLQRKLQLPDSSAGEPAEGADPGGGDVVLRRSPLMMCSLLSSDR